MPGVLEAGTSNGERPKRRIAARLNARGPCRHSVVSIGVEATRIRTRGACPGEREAGQPLFQSMLLLVLFVGGFVAGLGLGLLAGTTRRRLVLAGFALALLAMYAIYVAAIASCPPGEECAKYLGVFFL